MPFAWGQPILPVCFKCKHCEKQLIQIRNSVEACDCEESRNELIKEKELRKQWIRKNEPSMVELRERNKRPLR